jgi:hypothetical protein
MKNSISLLMFVLLGVLGYLPSTAQQYFNKRYTAGANANVFSSALERNNRFYVIMGGIDSTNYLGGGLFKTTTGLKFIVLDNTGNIITSKLYKRDDKKETFTLPAGFTVSNNFVSLDDGTFLYAVAVIDTVLAPYNPSYLNTQSAIIRFDSMGNVLMYKEYDRAYCFTTDATNHLFADFKPDAYGNWLMLSTMLCNGNRIVFNLRKLDNAFNEVWVKNFTTSSYHNTPKHLLIEDDGYVMTGGIDNGNVKLFPDYYSSVLIKCDTAGNKLWDWQNSFDTTKLQYIINDIIRTKDGGYIYCGTGEGRPRYFDFKTDWSGINVFGFIEKLDASRNSVWKTKIGFVGTDPKQNNQSILKELPNGDIIVAGTLAKNVTPKLGYSFGALTKINGIDGSVLWQRIYNFNPDTLSGFIYDMRPTADGGYILAGETKDDVVFPFDAPTQRGWLIKVDSNGCEWAGSPCNPTHISPLQSSLGAGFKVYPNPSNGTLLITSSSLSSTYVIARYEAIFSKVYDLLGRVVHQEPLNFSNNTATLQIQVPTGMYILELQSKESVLHRERIVIE